MEEVHVLAPAPRDANIVARHERGRQYVEQLGLIEREVRVDEDYLRERGVRLPVVDDANVEAGMSPPRPPDSPYDDTGVLGRRRVRDTELVRVSKTQRHRARPSRRRVDSEPQIEMPGPILATALAVRAIVENISLIYLLII